LEGGEPWEKLVPPYCQWVLFHCAPTPIVVKLMRGKADIRIDGFQYPMYPNIEIHCQGTVEVHNTQQEPRKPEERTEIWYYHLE